MKNFEERYTAWLDGTMDDAERVAFEKELPDRDEAMADRDSWSKLRGSMRDAVSPARMPHPDFVNSQVLAVIRREQSVGTKHRDRGAVRLFPLGRLAFAGAFLVVLAAVLSFVFLPGFGQGVATTSEVVEARGGTEKTYAYSFEAPGRASVLWIDNAGYIPASEHL